MRRRDFIHGIAASAVWPLVARAQQVAMPVIGLVGTSREALDIRLGIFREGLKDAGFIEGQNVAIEYRWSEGQTDRLPKLTAELVRRPVAVIVAASGTPGAMAAKAATATIPVVFAVSIDPVKAGLVASLNRPGENLTGVTNLNVEIGPKRLELLHALMPTATIFGVLVDPTSRGLSDPFVSAVQTAAEDLGLKIHVLHATTERDFEAVFASLAQFRVSGLIIDQVRTTSAGLSGSPRSRPTTQYQRSSSSALSLPPAACSAMAATRRNTTGWSATLPAGFSRASCPPRYRYSNRRRSN